MLLIKKKQFRFWKLAALFENATPLAEKQKKKYNKAERERMNEGETEMDKKSILYVKTSLGWVPNCPIKTTTRVKSGDSLWIFP